MVIAFQFLHLYLCAGGAYWTNRIIKTIDQISSHPGAHQLQHLVIRMYIIVVALDYDVLAKMAVFIKQMLSTQNRPGSHENICFCLYF